MIHIVTAENRKLYEKEMLEQHRIRHDIYVRENNWKNLKVEDGRESDQFDNDDATYILAIEDGKVLGGSRFIPTIKPHLLSDVFSSLAEVRGIPRSPDIFEWTRLFTVSGNVIAMRGPAASQARFSAAGLSSCLVRKPPASRW